MHSTLNQQQSDDDPHDFVLIAPDAVRVTPANDGLADLERDLARYRSDSQTHTGSDFSAGPPVPSVDTTFRPATVDDFQIPDQIADDVPGHRRSIGGRAMRALIGLLFTACIGGAAFAWQSHGDAAKRMMVEWAPQFVLTSLALEKPEISGQPAPAAVQPSAANAAPAQPAPPAQTAPEGVARAADVLSPESAQLLQSMARDLAAMGQEIGQLRASVEQLKASQQQVLREVAKTSDAKTSDAKTSDAKTSDAKASDQNPRPRIAAAPPRPVAAPARKPTPPLPPPQAAHTPPLPQTDARYVPRQLEPPPQPAAQPPTDPELASVPRPPMPLR